MLARLPSLKLVRLWAALLLATIGLQASVSSAPSVQKTSGSAFSASTYEVALYVQRGERVQRQALAPQPLVPLVPIASPLAAAAELVDCPPPCPDATGPPVREIRSWKSAPRGPPLA